MIIGIFIVGAMTYFNPVKSSGHSLSINYNNLNLLFIAYIFIAGMVGISAMVLPGILIFGCGITLGVLLTIRTVRYLFRNYRSKTIYCIIGLMIGSIYSVIMGPTSLEVPKAPMSISTFSIVFFLIGCILVPALEKFKAILENKNSESNIRIDSEK